MTTWLIRNKATNVIPSVAFESEKAALRYIGGWGPDWEAVWTHIFTLEEVNDIVDRAEG